MPRLIIFLIAIAFASPIKAEDDRILYQNIVERVHDGEGYYSVAADELRERNFPLKPPMAFRPPTLAVFLGVLPNSTARFLMLVALALGAVFSWMRLFSDSVAWERIATIALLVCGLANVGAPSSVYLHEAWAICFIALSLAFYRKLALSLGFAFIAVLIRETAILFPIAMGLVALFEHDWRRAFALVALGLAAGMLWAWHAVTVLAVVTPFDPVSPGWLAIGGFEMVLASSKWNLLTSGLNETWLMLALALFAISLLTVKRIELRVAAIFVALFALVLLFVGRPDNNYWGIMISPFLAIGLPSFAKKIAEVYRSKFTTNGSG